jgi:hypothetical protein
MTNYPTNWGEVYYLVRKEVRERSDLPALSLKDISQLSNIFWKQVKGELGDTSGKVRIPGLINFEPRLKQIKRSELHKKLLKERYEKQKKESIQPFGPNKSGSKQGS